MWPWSKFTRYESEKALAVKEYQALYRQFESYWNEAQKLQAQLQGEKVSLERELERSWHNYETLRSSYDSLVAHVANLATRPFAKTLFDEGGDPFKEDDKLETIFLSPEPGETVMGDAVAQIIEEKRGGPTDEPTDSVGSVEHPPAEAEAQP